MLMMNSIQATTNATRHPPIKTLEAEKKDRKKAFQFHAALTKKTPPTFPISRSSCGFSIGAHARKNNELFGV